MELRLRNAHDVNRQLRRPPCYRPSTFTITEFINNAYNSRQSIYRNWKMCQRQKMPTDMGEKGNG